MKVMRFELPGSPGETKVGFVDLGDNKVVDSVTVLGRMGIRDPLARAVDIICFNVEKAGALSQGLENLAKYDAPRWGLDEVLYLPSIEAGSLRDFIAFEQHIKTVREQRGAEIPDVWYRMPVYYKGNYRSLSGHDQQLTWPRYSQQMDYELELACIVGKEGIDIAEGDAETYIGGYALMNDWSARDTQFEEMVVGLGPAKGKDFATSVGPWVVTPDEFNPGDARMTARINGELWSDGNIGQIHWTFPKMIAHVSMDEVLYPGDIFGSGTVGGGCGLELDRWLQSGDVVELEAEGIGVLRNRGGAAGVTLGHEEWLMEEGPIVPTQIPTASQQSVTGRRIAAAFIDFIPLLALYSVMAAVLGEVDVGGSTTTPQGESRSGFSASLGGWAFLHFVGLALAYYVLTEGMTGTTPGKWVLGLTVVKLDGHPYGWRSVMARNIFRVIDGLPIFYLLGIITIALTRRKRRLGDLAAGTTVVRASQIMEGSAATDSLTTDDDAVGHASSPRTTSLVPRIGLALFAFALVSGLSILVSPRTSDDPQVSLISPGGAETDLQFLATGTLLAFDRAVQQGYFDSFYADMSETFRSQISLDEFEGAFKQMAESGGSIIGIINVRPVFDRASGVDDEGVLKLSGYYPTSPSRLLFDLHYVWEDSSWKLIAFRMNTE